jgi:hypothetical protein
MEKSITVGEMRRLIKESQGQFSPVIGKGVESENKKNNDKSYKDAKTKTNAKEVKVKHNYSKENDYNRTTLDYTFDYDPGKQWKERVHAQAKGYTSKIESENDIEKNAEFGDDFYKEAKKVGQKLHKNKESFKKSGLQAEELPDDAFKKEDMYESKEIKTVRFKKTEFLTEEHMMSKIPDEMKCEGRSFKMKDKNDQTYLLEWTKNQYNGKESAIILEHTNKKKVDESLERMKALYGFKPGEKTSTTTVQSRVFEQNNGVKQTLDNIRNYKM